jgi:hypothetical protein
VLEPAPLATTRRSSPKEGSQNELVLCVTAPGADPRRGSLTQGSRGESAPDRWESGHRARRQKVGSGERHERLILSISADPRAHHPRISAQRLSGTEGLSA